MKGNACNPTAYLHLPVSVPQLRLCVLQLLLCNLPEGHDLVPFQLVVISLLCFLGRLFLYAQNLGGELLLCGAIVLFRLFGGLLTALFTAGFLAALVLGKVRKFR